MTSISSAFAQDEQPTTTEVVIEEEETPEAAPPPQDKTNYILLGVILGMGIIMIGILYKNYAEKNKKIRLNITGINPNGDGSYMVKWGYENPTNKNIVPEKMELNVTKGSAILLKSNEDKEIKPGKNNEVMVTVVNQDTLLEWTVDDQKLIFDGKNLKP